MGHDFDINHRAAVEVSDTVLKCFIELLDKLNAYRGIV